MKIVSGYFVYRAYTSYKAHFSASNTDISKYGFRLFKPSYDTFLCTKGKQFYDKIAKRLQTEVGVTNLFITAFLEDPDLWIGAICGELSTYIEKMVIRDGRLANMPYVFAKDATTLLRSGMKFNDDMAEFCFDALMSSSIELESFIILKKMFNLRLDNNTTHDYLYSSKYIKYEFLLKVGLEKYKTILEEAVMQNRD